MRYVFLWAEKCFKEIPHHPNLLLHSENGLIGAFREHSRDLGRFVAYQDLRSGGRVHHLDYPAIHIRLGGQSVGRKATETLIVPKLAGELPAMNAGHPRSEYFGLTGVKNTGRSAVPESTLGKTSPQPATAITHIYRQPRICAGQPTQAVEPGSGQRGTTAHHRQDPRKFEVGYRDPNTGSWRLSSRISRPPVAPEPPVNSSRWGALPLGALERPPTARRVGEIPHGVNPMSPAAGHPATGRSSVAPVGDTCRLVKLRFRFPGMIFMDVQAAGGNRATCQGFTAGVPCRPPRFLVLGSF